MLYRRAAWHPLALDAVLAALLTTVGNIPLWLALVRLSPTHSMNGWVYLAGFGLVLFTTLVALLGLVLWRPWRRAMGVVLITAAGMASYFMLSYGVVIDTGMVANALHTDAAEVRGLLGWPLFLALALGVFLPSIWWCRARTIEISWKRVLWQRGVIFLLALTVMGLTTALIFKDLASNMRNNKSLRYMINPYNSIYATVRQITNEKTQTAKPLLPVGLDAVSRVPQTDAETSPVVVVVVGETVRAANFGLGGYARDTTPRLAALKSQGDMTYFSNVLACGTSTQVSLPCMFSRQGRSGLDGPKEESVLDVFQRAGWSTFWLDNQSGCKGVCARVPNHYAYEMAPKKACEGDQCPDAVMAQLLPDLLNETSQNQRSPHGTILVLHQMGNHGPAYYLRSEQSTKKFLPECRTNVLSSCSQQEIVNAYDNAILETDQLLANLVEQLKKRSVPTALLYVSDHGESLGENLLYLHGMPWALAPEEQKHVPMLLWMSQSMRERLNVRQDCLEKMSVMPWSHDNLFHTLLGMARISTSAEIVDQNIIYRCQKSMGSAVAAPVDRPVG